MNRKDPSLQRGGSEMARRLFEQALELEPESPEAIIQQTFCLGWALWARRGSDAEVAEMRQLAHRAIVADPDDGRGHMLAGIAEMWLRQPGRARTLFERAIALNPSLCQAHAELGCHYMVVGTMSALRDSRKFTCPGAFEPGRDLDPALMFGEGSHVCLGAYLAMEQITEICQVLFSQPDTPWAARSC